MNRIRAFLSPVIRKAQEMYSRFGAVNFIIVTAALAIGLIAGLFSIPPGLEQSILSRNILATAKPSSIGQNIVVVMCTDETLTQLSPDKGWPIDRSYYTELLEGPLSASDTVVFDILFADSVNAETDRAFADAVAAHGGVVLARSDSTLPIDPLFLSGARIGYAAEFNENNSDGVIRRYKLYVNNDHSTGPTLICSAMLSQGYSVTFDGRSTYTITSPDGSKSISLPVDSEGYFFRIPLQHGSDVQVIDLYDVRCGNYEDGMFDDAVVFIGGTVAGFEDIVYAPDFPVGNNYSNGSSAMRVVGTKYLADCYNTVLSGISPVSTPKWAEGLFCIALFLLCAFLSLHLSARINWLLPIGFGFLWYNIARQLFVSGTCYIPTVTPIWAIFFGYLLVTVIRLARTSRERMVSSLPIETFYHLAYELSSTDIDCSYSDYIHSFADDVFEKLGTQIIYAQTGRAGIPSLLRSDQRSGTSVLRSSSVDGEFDVRYLIVIPLPVFGDDENSCTVLGVNRYPSSHWVQSVTSLVLAMYVYYKAQRHGAEKQQMAMSMISLIIQMIDAKDPVTAGHSRRVSRYSRQIAEWLGFDRQKATDVEFAALLHDIGKIGVADAVLNKPGLFTNADFAQMRSHPSLGADIARTVGLSDEIVDGILHHHERLDGRGYPDGTAGGEFARIIKVADVFDALTSQRQYKSAWSAGRAIEVIRKGIGMEFDEQIANTFIEHTLPKDDSEVSPSQKSEQPSAEPVSYSRPAAFAKKLLSVVEQPLNVRQDTMNTMDSPFEFDCSSRFAGLEWGERVHSSEVLRSKPDILHYDVESGSVITALRGMPSDVVHSSICYFHKGCMSAGMIVLNSGKAADAAAVLSGMYGQPTDCDGVSVWRAAGHVAVGIFSDEPDCVVFITNYLVSEI